MAFASAPPPGGSIADSRLPPSRHARRLHHHPRSPRVHRSNFAFAALSRTGFAASRAARFLHDKAAPSTVAGECRTAHAEGATSAPSAHVVLPRPHRPRHPPTSCAPVPRSGPTGAPTHCMLNFRWSPSTPEPPVPRSVCASPTTNRILRARILNATRRRHRRRRSLSTMNRSHNSPFRFRASSARQPACAKKKARKAAGLA